MLHGHCTEAAIRELLESPPHRWKASRTRHHVTSGRARERYLFIALSVVTRRRPKPPTMDTLRLACRGSFKFHRDGWLLFFRRSVDFLHQLPHNFPVKWIVKSFVLYFVRPNYLCIHPRSLHSAVVCLTSFISLLSTYSTKSLHGQTQLYTPRHCTAHRWSSFPPSHRLHKQT